MNLHKKKHQLLSILYNRITLVELNFSDDNVIGVSYENIMNNLNCSKRELLFISSELITNGEIEYHDAHNVKGYFAKPIGLTSYTNEKYFKIRNQILIERAKNIVQIFIPVLSLIIALITILIKVDTINSKNDDKLNKVKQEINSLKEQVYKLEKSAKLFQKTKSKI